jgi:hypothetical protein
MDADQNLFSVPKTPGSVHIEGYVAAPTVLPLGRDFRRTGPRHAIRPPTETDGPYSPVAVVTRPSTSSPEAKRSARRATPRHSRRRRIPLGGVLMLGALVASVIAVSLNSALTDAKRPAVGPSRGPLAAASVGGPATALVVLAPGRVPTTTPSTPATVVPTTVATTVPTTVPRNSAPPVPTHTVVAKPVTTTTAPPPSSSTSGIVPPDNPPEAPLWGTPSFQSACQNGGNTAGCLSEVEQAIDNARSADSEGIAAIGLPSDFLSLTSAEQIFVLTDTERVERGLAPIQGLVDDLDQQAASAAADDEDPSPGAMPAGVTWRAWKSNFAESDGPLATDYQWMYADGPGGENDACQSGNMTGCWAHRDNILWNLTSAQLGGQTLIMGAAQTEPSGTPYVNDAELIELVEGTPAYVYTWAQAVSAGAG